MAYMARNHSGIRLKMSRRVDLTCFDGKSQEGVWLLVISLAYPRQTLPTIDVQWPSRARDACAKNPVSRRDFPANPHSLDRSFSSMLLVNRG